MPKFVTITDYVSIRNLPRAIVIGLPIIIFVYALINISLFAVLSIHDIIISDSGAIAIVSVNNIYWHTYAYVLCDIYTTL